MQTVQRHLDPSTYTKGNRELEKKIRKKDRVDGVLRGVMQYFLRLTSCTLSKGHYHDVCKDF